VLRIYVIVFVVDVVVACVDVVAIVAAVFDYCCIAIAVADVVGLVMSSLQLSSLLFLLRVFYCAVVSFFFFC